MSKQSVEKIQNLIKSKQVFVASKSYCPYCKASKQLLDEINADAYVIELDQVSDGGDLQDALASITGQRTVPNIFIGGKHIGGNSDLQALGKKAITEKIKAAASA
ncbi:unnamed protein product [Ambrosiozyma monospora]|uniref:Unnamed protein product n=1 Tax=Ambrosiozyma monospora TaxID=43982 RepID=A0A9W6YQX9_AMBMO|nr:unnamed protein product [Ambrosiozyma monospora]